VNRPALHSFFTRKAFIIFVNKLGRMHDGILLDMIVTIMTYFVDLCGFDSMKSNYEKSLIDLLCTRMRVAVKNR
jgi:hypothetical protein